MHYVRLLKPLSITTSRGTPQLDLLFSIQTDLGDSFYPCNIDIQVSVHRCREGKTCGQLWSTKLSWKATDRQVSASLPSNAWRPSTSDQFVISLDPSCPRSLQEVRAHLSEPVHVALPPVLGLRTLPFRAMDGHCPRTILRRIPNFDPDSFEVAEDLGESIARHVWDAGVAAAAYVAHSIDPSIRERAGVHSILSDLARRADVKKIHVLELGAGVGLLGSAIAACLSQAEVLLTDLEEAEELIRANITFMESRKLAGRLRFQALDWTEALPQAVKDFPLDLIVASDCTYNPDFSPALVRIVNELDGLYHGVPFMLAVKERHPSEQVFFDNMREAHFSVLHHESVLSPLEHTNDGLHDAEQIDLYVFRKNVSL